VTEPCCYPGGIREGNAGGWVALSAVVRAGGDG
jgi:hypothetical protein